MNQKDNHWTDNEKNDKNTTKKESKKELKSGREAEKQKWRQT
jgi:hypothetical protein